MDASASDIACSNLRELGIIHLEQLNNSRMLF